MSAHLAIAYKNFALHSGVSHIGLGIAALHVAKSLKRCGVKTTVLPLQEPLNLAQALQRDK